MENQKMYAVIIVVFIIFSIGFFWGRLTAPTAQSATEQGHWIVN